jgi:RimJ/RimL family protein N-acetyltransferase
MGTDIELLRLEMETLWEPDDYGRLRPHPLVAVAVADEGLDVRFSPDLTPVLRERLEGIPLPCDVDGSQPPEILNEYQRVIGQDGKARGGPSYMFEGIPSRPDTNLLLATSEDELSPALWAARPEAWWEADEWEDLSAGRLGPWAVGMIEGRVAALCHTPVGSRVAAEAGVWTHPEYRGRGYAGAVTAAWAKVASQRFDTLFYSTGSDNTASQAVARKLGLRQIGWIWQIEASDGCG